MQPDMTVAGVADIATDWRMQVATQWLRLFGANVSAAEADEGGGLLVNGTLPELLAGADVVVDCAQAGRRREYRVLHGGRKKFILQGGEKHETTDTRSSPRLPTRCDRPSQYARRVLQHHLGREDSWRAQTYRSPAVRARNPAPASHRSWESHETGIMNTLVPEPSIPSHQGPDAQERRSRTRRRDDGGEGPRDAGPSSLLERAADQGGREEEVLAALRTSTRIALIRGADGLGPSAGIKEWMLDIGRPHGDLYEVALWEDMLTVRGDELFYAYMVDNQAISFPRRSTPSAQSAASLPMRQVDIHDERHPGHRRSHGARICSISAGPAIHPHQTRT